MAHEKDNIILDLNVILCKFILHKLFSGLSYLNNKESLYVQVISRKSHIELKE